MLNVIELILKDLFSIEGLKILEKEQYEQKDGYSVVSVTKKYLLRYKRGISYDKIHKVKIFLEDFLLEYEEIKKSAKKLKILQKELDNVLYSSEKFLSKKGKIEDFFSFANEFGLRFALMENFNIIVNSGIDKYTLKATVKKLKKQSEISLPIANGELFAIEEGSYVAIFESDKKIDNFLKKVIKARLLWLDKLYEAYHNYTIDKDTGFYTRNRFLQDIKKGKLKKKHFVFVNIKNFKMINEIHTAYIGDKVLQELASVLKEFACNDELIYRVYGDRFAIAFKKMSSAKNFVDKVLDSFKKDIMIYNTNTKEYIKTSLNLNFVVFENLHIDILEKANFSFDKCKKEICFFEEDVKPLIMEEIECINIINDALENDGIVPFFQKIVDIRTAKTVYYEALMRIVLKEKVFLPLKFIEVSKRAGLYKKLNFTMIKKSIKAAKKLDNTVSINIDIYDVLEKGFFNFIKNEISRNGVDPKNIQFELLESEDVYEFLDEIKEFLKKIKKIGCRVAIDDFGTGYSNFVNLKDIPVDVLKIDMSLIKNINTDDKSRYIAGTVAKLASLLNIKTTAEGVSSKEIYEILKELNINSVQGFYFSKPQRLEEVISS